MARTTDSTPWHAGELEARRRAGVDPQHTAAVTAFLRPFLTEQHRAFYPRLPFIVAGSVDDAGRPWATILEGQPGFLRPDDDTHLRIAARPLEDDPAAVGFALGRAVGLLGIELETRRRNRLNGHVVDIDEAGLQLEVDRAYGNCPKYIHTRDMRFEPAPLSRPPAERLDALDAAARQTIASSGTFFVASYADEPKRQVDVSHRGGRPGFVEVDAEWLTVPDFAGNQFFNTLGNFIANPKAGLLFPDFVSGDVLQLSGSVEVAFDSPRLTEFDGAQRLWRVKVETAIRRRGVLHWRGGVRDESTEAELTGTWAEARGRAITAQGWRPFRVEAVVDETPDVRSYALRPTDDAIANLGRAGMHLVLRLGAEGTELPLMRSYSLSRVPTDGSYRISVKAEGEGSREIHRRLVPGAVIEGRGPQGEFVVDLRSTRPVVLLSAGIGITPMRAMAEQVLTTDCDVGRRRRIHFLHGARDGRTMPFTGELLALRESANGMLTLTRCFSRPRSSDRLGDDFEFEGHLGIDTLKAVLPFDDHDFYLCGPSTFMQQMYDGLRAMGIADDRIRAEGFGPSSIRRSVSVGVGVRPAEVLDPAQTPVAVRFSRAGREAIWSPGGGTLLELAERSGLQPDFGCREGSCGTCRTPVLTGDVAYPNGIPPSGPSGTALICCAVPARVRIPGTGLTLDL